MNRVLFVRAPRIVALPYKVLAGDKSRLTRELLGSQAKCFAGLRLRYSIDLKKHLSWTASRYPIFWCPFPFTHPYLSRLLRHGLVWEDPDPNFSFPLDGTGHGNPRSFNLAGSDESGFQAFNAEGAEFHISTARSETFNPPFLLLSKLCLLRL